MSAVIEEIETKICSTCGQELPLSEFHKNKTKKHGIQSQCKNCHNNGQKNRSQKRITNGVCPKCGKTKLLNNQLCEKHWYEGKALENLGTRTLGPAIKKIAEKQNFICPYEGVKLIPGLNMSLDHIKCVKDHPDMKYNLNNLQWVTYRVNVSKNTMTHFGFIKFICKIYKNIFKK